MPNIKSADSVYYNVPTTERSLDAAFRSLYQKTLERDTIFDDLSADEDLVARFTAVIRGYNSQGLKNGRYAASPVLDQESSRSLIYLYHTLATSALDQDMLNLLNNYTFSVQSEMAANLIRGVITRRINPPIVPALFQPYNNQEPVTPENTPLPSPHAI